MSAFVVPVGALSGRSEGVFVETGAILAGAAGMIKTLLALNHKVLPPSLHFEKPPANSPLIDSPFRVQTEAEKWLSSDAQIPRRAAVSAFGFGGINGHLLFEEWDPESPYASGRSAAVQSTRSAGRTIDTISDPDIKPSATVEQKNIPIVQFSMLRIPKRRLSNCLRRGLLTMHRLSTQLILITLLLRKLPVRLSLF